MFLIDQPYVSDFLINTIKDSRYKIVSTREARELISDNDLNWISEDEAIADINTDPGIQVYLNSENALSWIYNNLTSSRFLYQIQQFKDKAKFRELVKSSFPEFFFKSVNITDLYQMDVADIKFPFVIKPSLGFFSLGVHIIHNLTDWARAKEELSINKLQNIYPEDVLNTTNFVIEEYIEGEEYAIDCYFNNLGEIVILNILHHNFSSGKDISHRVYSTSRGIILRHKSSIEDFLNPIGKRLGLKNFPAHVEIRVDQNGKIRPIEVNPLRFGGWCTTSDLSWYAYGINSYNYFFCNKKPDWENILSTKGDNIFSLIVLNNNSGIETEDISGFNYDMLENDFENVLTLRKLELGKHSVFGFIFTETSPDNIEELDTILISDLKKYITLK